jgi:hypothetical protein
LICEGAIERKTEHQKVCRKISCRNALKAGFDAFGMGVAGAALAPLKTPDFIGSKQPLRDDRAPSWRVVAAGTPIRANFYHCAVVPDGPNCQWDGGEYQRLEQRNRRRPLNPRILKCP